jgi:uncharacterized membrane protein
VRSALYVIAVLIGVNLTTFIGLYAFMHRSLKLHVAWVSVGKYIFAAAVMGATLYVLPTTTTLISTITKAIGGFALYIGLLLAIDKQARQLIKLIWQEITGSIAELTSRNNNRNNENDIADEKSFTATGN